jgi:hypothetical protein
LVANDYALEELGPRAFEQLAVALAAAVVGTGIEAFGSGRDGGREATFTGRIPWSTEDGGDVWDGYTVLQAKQKQHPSGDPARDLAWLAGQIREEFDEWMRADSQRGRFPNYLIFVTNVRLTSQSGTGGIDRINRLVSQRVEHNYGSDDRPDTPGSRGLRAVKVWHRDYLNARLSQHADIRAAFPALLTVGDLLTRLHALPGFVEPEQFAPVLIDHAQNTLRAEQWVRFEDAGDTSSNKRPVDRVVVNLPARIDKNRFSCCTTSLNAVMRCCASPSGATRDRGIW